MKIYLLVFIFGCLFYFWFECILNRLSNKDIVEKALHKSKYECVGWASLWMSPFGGICGVLILLAYKLFFINLIIKYNWLIWIVMLIGSIIITGIELVGGLLLNVKFKLRVWDYSFVKIGNIPLNYKGQISVLHSLLWFSMSFVAIKISDFLIWIIK